MADASSNLALIYSRLAALESQNQEADIVNSITEAHSLNHLPAEEICKLDAQFSAAAAGPDYINAIKALFEAEQKMKDDLCTALAKNGKEYHAKKLSMDRLTADTLRLQEATKGLAPQLSDVSDLCRNLQLLVKEKDARNRKLLEEESEKTASIERECGASLGSVSTKIDAEEADIAVKAQENSDLRSKIDQFRDHLELRRERQRNEEKTKDLMAKLEAAKAAQKAYLDEQDRMKRDSCKSKIVHTHETILQLKAQLSMFDKKFVEFESTLERTESVMHQMLERETSLTAVVQRLKDVRAALAKQTAQADAELIAALDEKKTVEDELQLAKRLAADAEKRCRQLQAKRKDRASRTTSSTSGDSGAGLASQG